MKKIGSLLLIFVLVIGISGTATAQGSFILGMATGMMLGSSGDNYGAGSGGTIIYLAPRVSERVKSIFDVRQISVRGDFERDFKAISIWELFHEAMKGSVYISRYQKSNDMQIGNYEILRVDRVFDGQDLSKAAFWFAFIEKSKLIPLDKLPELKK